MADLIQTVEDYLACRNLIEQIKEKHKLELEALETDFDALAAQLLEVCNSNDADTIRTSAGTISRTVRSRYWTNDWPSMYDTIRKFDAPFLLEQRIHNGNMKEFLKDNPEAVPPGLQAEKKYVIQVRKPTAK